MYRPKGKITTQVFDAEEENTGISFVPPVQYDNLIKNKNVYELRTTIPVPPYMPIPTQEQYVDGYLVRYFVQHKSSGEVLEVSRDVYSELAKKTSKYHHPSYFLGSSRWRLRGPVADKEINGYIVEGASKENEFFLEELQKSLPNIRTYLTDPGEFVK